MPDKSLSEVKFFHLITTVMGALFLGICGYIAYNATLIPVMAEHIANIDKKIDEGFTFQGRRIEDHENRIRALETKK